MLLLGTDELKQAEVALKLLFPESIKVYGCLFGLNRGKPLNLEVIVDSWPDFKAIVCKPKKLSRQDREGEYNIYHVYSKDKESLKELLGASAVLNWDVFTLIGGVDINHLNAVEELAVWKNVPTKRNVVTNVLMLGNSSQLKVQKRLPGCTLRPVTRDDAHLINRTWTYGGSQSSLNSVLNYISHNPSLCVIEEGGTSPVSWLLVYQYSALGLLYTVPECRGKGYGKLLVSLMAEQLLQQGYPVFCFVEENNEQPYRLFTSLGFTHKAGHQAVWLELNERLATSASDS